MRSCRCCFTAGGLKRSSSVEDAKAREKEEDLLPRIFLTGPMV